MILGGDRAVSGDSTGLMFAIAAMLQRDTLTQVLFGIAAAALAVTAVLQWRMRRSR